jgi:hypothetical protein
MVALVERVLELNKRKRELPAKAHDEIKHSSRLPLESEPCATRFPTKQKPTTR